MSLDYMKSVNVGELRGIISELLKNIQAHSTLKKNYNTMFRRNGKYEEIISGLKEEIESLESGNVQYEGKPMFLDQGKVHSYEDTKGIKEEEEEEEEEEML